MNKKTADIQTPEEAIQKRRRQVINRQDVTTFVFRAAVLLLFLCITFNGVFKIRIQSGDDMKPTLRAGDIQLIYCFPSDLWNNDLVAYEAAGKSRTGRIVARPGDTVEITEDQTLKVNGGTVSESEIYYSTPAYDSDVEYPIQLSDDEYFILSDFREGAQDSRQFGPVSRKQIIGKLSAVFRRTSL